MEATGPLKMESDDFTYQMVAQQNVPVNQPIEISVPPRVPCRYCHSK